VLLTAPPRRDSRILAGVVEEASLEMIAKNEERLLRHPRSFAALYMTRDALSTAQRALELRCHNVPSRDPRLRRGGARHPAVGRDQSGRGGQGRRRVFRAAEVASTDGGAALVASTGRGGAPGEADAPRRAGGGSAGVPTKGEAEEDLGAVAAARFAWRRWQTRFARAVLIRDTNRQVRCGDSLAGVSDMRSCATQQPRPRRDIIATPTTAVGAAELDQAGAVQQPQVSAADGDALSAHLNARDLKMLSRSKGISSRCRRRPSSSCNSAQ